MDVIWLAPAAWWGLATLAIPIAIHLLTRQQTRRLLFPTLRFVHATRLAALRRRSIHDWPLLLIRAATLAAAVAALAGPVFMSTARKLDWQTRLVRAFVIAPGAPDVVTNAELVAEMRADLATAVFRPDTAVADGLRDAAVWLDRQPPAAREVVVMGDLKQGLLDEPDLALLTPSTGLRFLPLPDTSNQPATVQFPFATMTVHEDRTMVTYGRKAGLKSSSTTVVEQISVRAAAEDEALARAARDAIVARGVRVDRAGQRRVLAVFEGGEKNDLRLQQPAEAAWMRDALARLPRLTGGQAGGTLVVLVPQRAHGVETAHVLDRIARAAFAEDLHMFEQRRIPTATLARWSRPPQLDMTGPLSDEGDRRWLWSLALVLIALESLMRRSRDAASHKPVMEQQRVA